MRLAKAGVMSLNPQFATLAIMVALKARLAADSAGAKLSSFPFFKLFTRDRVRSE